MVEAAARDALEGCVLALEVGDVLLQALEEELLRIVWTLTEERERAGLANRKHLNGHIFEICGEAKTRLNLISTSLFDCIERATSPSDWIRE